MCVHQVQGFYAEVSQTLIDALLEIGEGDDIDTDCLYGGQLQPDCEAAAQGHGSSGEEGEMNKRWEISMLYDPGHESDARGMLQTTTTK